MVQHNNTDKGRQGEFLAAYILETYGVEVHHVDRSGSDLWCRVNDAIITVQVKAASMAKRGSGRSTVPYYTYLTKNKDAHYFCFVALDLELIILRPTDQVTASTTRVAPADFNEADQRRTIEEMLA